MTPPRMVKSADLTLIRSIRQFGVGVSLQRIAKPTDRLCQRQNPLPILGQVARVDKFSVDRGSNQLTSGWEYE